MSTQLTSTGVLYPDGRTSENYITATRAIFGYGSNGSGSQTITNLVSNSGVVATDNAGIGTVRYILAAASYSS